MSKDFRVLITDDDPDNLALMTSVLRRAGYDVFPTKSGEECLHAAQDCRPALLLLDVVLPDISGIEVLRQVKSSPTLTDAFVILMSGVDVSSERQADGLNIGADGYITKPISNKELVARVQAMERIKIAEDALREKERELQESVSYLRAALSEIKVLKGLIPICSSCKKIRNDLGFWDQLESYLSEHTDAIFTHGLCPECFQKTVVEIRGMRKQDAK
ncbi:MAG TPA: response regulator [Syntrophorhabdaceae bacterium]|nr:response regulator [Syntrophorhabdaceae bacterium]